jgi:hypothetical protein
MNAADWSTKTLAVMSLVYGKPTKGFSAFTSAICSALYPLRRVASGLSLATAAKRAKSLALASRYWSTVCPAAWRRACPMSAYIAMAERMPCFSSALVYMSFTPVSWLGVVGASSPHCSCRPARLAASSVRSASPPTTSAACDSPCAMRSHARASITSESPPCGGHTRSVAFAAPTRCAMDHGAFASLPKGDAKRGSVSANRRITVTESSPRSSAAPWSCAPLSAAASLTASCISCSGERPSSGFEVVSVTWPVPTMTGMRVLSICAFRG